METTMTTRTLTLGALFTLLACGTAMHPAAAADPTAAASVTVNYADLDLAREAGAKALRDRIRKAVSAVCSYPGISDLHIRDVVEQCKREAMAQANAQLASTRVAMITVQRPAKSR